MPRYSYKAYDANGVLRSGEISAGTRGGALEALSRRNETPIDLSDLGAEQPLPWWQREIGRRKLTYSELADFTRELSSLVKASLPIDESLRILALQPLIPSRRRRMIEELLRRVIEGEQLSAALESQKGFPEYYSRLVAAGEMSGALAQVLEQLAAYLERTAESRARLLSALAYPSLLIVAALAVVAAISLLLIPAVLPVFADAGVEPPLVIRILAHFATISPEAWIMLAAVLIGGILLVLHNGSVKQAADRLLLDTPLIRQLVVQRETARFSRTFSMLLGSGVPMLDSLRISGATLSSPTFRGVVAEAQRHVKEGSTFASALNASNRFPPLFLRLATVGEETGQLATMTLKAAEIYEAAFQRRADWLAAMATPVLTLLIGGIVGLIVVSVLSAVISMNSLALQ